MFIKLRKSNREKSIMTCEASTIALRVKLLLIGNELLQLSIFPEILLFKQSFRAEVF